jgi:DNA-binding transcriptional regulator of glucitol operon
LIVEKHLAFQVLLFICAAGLGWKDWTEYQQKASTEDGLIVV